MTPEHVETFPYTLTPLDEFAAKQAMTNPDSQPLIVYSDAAMRGQNANGKSNLRGAIWWLLAAGMLFALYLLTHDGPGIRKAPDETDHFFHWLLACSALLFFIGLTGIVALSKRRRWGDIGPMPERFAVTPRGLELRWTKLRMLRAWSLFKDYRDSGDVLVVRFKDRKSGITLPLRDVPPDRREAFRQMLKHALEGGQK